MKNSLENLHKSLNEAFWMTDIDKQKIVYISPGFEKIWGYDCQHLYKNPRSFIDAIHSEDRDRVIAAFSKQHEGNYDEIYRIIRPDGEIRWIHDKSFPRFMYDDEVQHVIGVAKDITEIKNFESKYFAILQASPVAMALNDNNQNITFVNLAFTRLFGYEQKDIPTLTDWWPKAYPNLEYQQLVIKQWLSELDRSQSTETPFHPLEIKICCNNGDQKTVMINAAMLDSSKSSDHLIIFYDITERKNQELIIKENEIKLLQASKLASLGEMAAGIAHEINNPLAIIVGMANQLNKFRDNPEKFSSKVDSIIHSADRIIKIVNGLKKFSRMSEKPEHQIYSLSQIIKEAVVLTQAKLAFHHTNISFEIDSEIKVICNDIEIEQVLVNLISNSIDAIKQQNEKWIIIKSFQDDQNIILQVKDSGPGIPIDVQKRLFDPFFTTKEVGEGTGLGLSISKGILDEHQATISVLPISNTCFEIRFLKPLE